MECLHRSEERLLNAASAAAPNLLQRLLDEVYGHYEVDKK